MLHLRPSLARVRNLVNNALVHRELLFAFRQIAAAAVRVPRLATLIFFSALSFFARGSRGSLSKARPAAAAIGPQTRRLLSAQATTRSSPPEKNPGSCPARTHAHMHAYSRGNRTALCTLFAPSAPLTLSCCREPREHSTRSQPEHIRTCGRRFR